MDRKGYYLSLLLFAVTALSVWAFGLILSPFLVPIAWAMCLLTVTGGLYRRLSKATRRPRLAAFLMTLTVGVAALVPVVLVGVTLVQEASALARKSVPPPAAVAPPAAGAPPTAVAPPTAGAPPPAPATAPSGDAWDDFFASHDRVRDAKEKVDEFLRAFDTDLRSMVDVARARMASPLASGAVGVLSVLFGTAFGFLMMLATLYFLYRDGDKIHAFLVDLVPIGREESDRVLETLRSTAFAAIVGGLLTAIIQGTLGGLAFVIVGVGAPVLWGFVMSVLSLLPVGGSAFVWAPTMVYFFIEGPTWKGWFLLAWGVIVIGASDNLLRPWLMRRAGATEVHPLLLFFAIISGIGLFGPSGIVFGPLLVALLIVVAKIYRENFGRAAAKTKPPPAA